MTAAAERLRAYGGLLARATRARVLPIMAIPTLLGAVLAWYHHGHFHPGLALITLAGTSALHLASNVTNDLFDFQRGTDGAARDRDDAVATDSGVLTEAAMSPAAMGRLNLFLYGFAGLTGIYLSLIRGWPVLALGGAGILLAVLYVAGPAYGYIGYGLGEVGIFFAFGPLPVVGSYFVQAGVMDGPGWLAALPVGLYATLILFCHHFLHWRNDRAMGKNNLVAVLGASRAAPIAVGLLGATYISMGAAVMAGAFPMPALAALLTAVAPGRAIWRLLSDQSLPAVGAVMAANFRGQLAAGVIITLSLIIDKFFL